MDRREALSFGRQFLDSPAFVHIFDVAFAPTVRTWAHRLLIDEDLPEGERRGIVIAMRELYVGFVRAHEECNLEIPEWLNKEFFRALISDE
jgi:hypothetical protein